MCLSEAQRYNSGRKYAQMCNYLVFKTDLSKTLAIDRCYKIQYLYTLNVAAWQQHCVNSVLLPENQAIFVNNFGII